MKRGHGAGKEGVGVGGWGLGGGGCWSMPAVSPRLRPQRVCCHPGLLGEAAWPQQATPLFAWTRTAGGKAAAWGGAACACGAARLSSGRQRPLPPRPTPRLLCAGHGGQPGQEGGHQAAGHAPPQGGTLWAHAGGAAQGGLGSRWNKRTSGPLSDGGGKKDSAGQAGAAVAPRTGCWRRAWSAVAEAGPAKLPGPDVCPGGCQLDGTPCTL